MLFKPNYLLRFLAYSIFLSIAFQSFSKANSLQYSVDFVSGEINLTGTITTDGSIGTELMPVNVLAWNLVDSAHGFSISSTEASSEFFCSSACTLFVSSNGSSILWSPLNGGATVFYGDGAANYFIFYYGQAEEQSVSPANPTSGTQERFYSDLYTTPGQLISIGSNPQPVPEPSTYSLLLAGLGLVGCQVRRR